MELIAIFLLNLIVGILATWIFEFILKTNKRLRDRYYRRHEILFGYHVHHSTVGLMLLVIGIILFFYNPSVAVGVIGFGIGIIIMHTISSKRFVFIERETFSHKGGAESTTYPQSGA